MKRVVALLVVTACALAGSRAQEGEAAPAPLDFTTLYQAIGQAFDGGDYSQVIALVEQMRENFGNSAQAQPVLESLRPLVALSYGFQGLFEEGLPEMEAALDLAEVNPQQKEILLFFYGTALLQRQEWPQAREVFYDFFQTPGYDPARRREALLMAGTTFLLDGEPEKGAEFLGKFRERIREVDPESAGRALVLQLTALLQANDLERATQLVAETQVAEEEIAQLVSFHSLLLQLGSRWMKLDQPGQALLVLRQVWKRERLIYFQEERLAVLEKQVEALAEREGRQGEWLQLERMRSKVERELAQVRDHLEFDAALQLRLAKCYYDLGRSMQAALLMREILERLEASPLTESVIVSLMELWLQTGRASDCLTAGETYRRKFQGEEAPSLAQVAYLEGLAHEDLRDYARAKSSFLSVVADFPEAEVAPRAAFMAGYMALMEEHYQEAVEQFASLLETYPQDPMAEDASYWTGMAWFFAEDYLACRQALSDYLGKVAAGEMAGTSQVAAEFRMAYCTFSLADYEAAIEELESWLQRNGKSGLASEAKVLLGDSFLALGQIEEGIEVYATIPSEETTWFEEGWFKTGKALKALGELTRFEGHYQEFVQNHAESLRVTEALHWLGWAQAKRGDSEGARATYWEAIRDYGGQASHHAIEEVFLALAKYYSEEPESWVRQLEALAEESDQTTLQLRCHWALGHALAGTRPERSQAAFLRAAQGVEVMDHNPRILADCAEAAVAAGEWEVAETLYTGLRRWHPNSLQVAGAYAGLAQLAIARREPRQAMQFLVEARERAFDPTLREEATLQLAALHREEGESPQAEALLSGLLEETGTSVRGRAESLLLLGDLRQQDGRLLEAAASYERVYLAFGRHLDLVAEAYWRRADLLENQLSRATEAREVLREMVNRPELASQAQTEAARERLQTLNALTEDG
ncbi:MAG: tetratricopeptide repeat protein [Verrucomicrobiota bacterium]